MLRTQIFYRDTNTLTTSLRCNQLFVFITFVTSEGKEKGSLKASRNSLVRDGNRRYASNFCNAARTS